MSIMNKDKQTPIAYASQRGYNLVAAELEHQLFQRQMREIAANARLQEEASRNYPPVIVENTSAESMRGAEPESSDIKASALVPDETNHPKIPSDCDHSAVV
jgi:hypothetical protein